MIKPEIIEKVKETANIVEVISDFVQLKQSGQNFKGLSPFVQENKPSFFVSPSKNIFKCFKSDIGGDAVKFLMKKENYSFIEAIRYLAEKYNIDLEEEVKKEKPKREKKLSELPALLLEIEKLSVQVEAHDTNRLSTEIEKAKKEILFLKDQKINLCHQLSKMPFSTLRVQLNKINTEFNTEKEKYDNADGTAKASLTASLNNKKKMISELRGLIAFKHLLDS